MTKANIIKDRIDNEDKIAMKLLPLKVYTFCINN